MAFSEQVKIIIDLVTDGARAQLKNLTTSIQEAEGVSGKLKAGVGGLGDMFKSAATSPAVLGSAVAAVGGFALKAVGDFAELGQEVGKFSDATGLSAEESSRWIEVAADMGISSDTLRGAIGKMEKTLGTNREAFKQFGIQVATAKDGTLDANATFLNAVDRLNAIKDPAEKAAAGAKIFGKGWAEMAELVGTGARDLQVALDSVEAGKVLDDADVGKARDYRDALDGLKGAVEDVTLKVGEALIPALTDLAETVSSLSGPLGALAKYGVESGPIGAITSTIDNVKFAVNGLSEGLNQAGFAEATAAMSQMYGASVGLTGVIMENRQAVDLNKKALDAAEASSLRTAEAQAALERRTRQAATAALLQKQAWDELTGSIDDDQAWVNMQTTVNDLEQAVRDAGTAAEIGGQQAEDANLAAQTSLNNLKRETVEYGKEVLGLPDKQVTELLAMIDRGSIAEYQAIMAELTRRKTQIIDVIARSPGGGAAGYFTGPRGATGGIVTKPTIAMIGEAGPEAVIPLNKTPGSSPLPDNLGGGGGVTINVDARGAIGLTGPQVEAWLAQGIKNYRRRNGPGSI